ncbi:hypothetical protein D3C78_1774740 [compost metagenome]
MTHEERIVAEINVWENAVLVYTKALEEDIKYGDSGGMKYSKHMIEFSQNKVEELEIALQQLKSA